MDEEKKSINVTIHGDQGAGAVAGEGDVNAEVLAGRDVVQGGAAGVDIFAPVEAMLARRPQPVRDAVEVIKEEAAKGDDANAQTTRLSFQVLAQMAPDILEVVAAAVTSPAAAVSAVVKKIAAKMQEDDAE